MTLDVEHLHSTVHTKAPLMSKQEYARAFGNTMKENLKRLVDWGTYYCTSEKSWYPPPASKVLSLSNIPKIEPLPVVHMPKENQDKMWEYSKTFGRGVRQRTNRQETTMAKHGALPDFVWQVSLTNVKLYIRQIFYISVFNASGNIWYFLFILLACSCYNSTLCTAIAFKKSY